MVEIAYSHDNHWGEARRTGSPSESGGLVGRPVGAGLSGEAGGEVGMEVERRLRWEWRGAGKTVA